MVALGATALLYLQVPTAFLPEEDQGYFILFIVPILYIVVKMASERFLPKKHESEMIEN